MNIWNKPFISLDRALVKEHCHMNYLHEYFWSKIEIKRRYFPSKIYIQ